VKRLVAVSARYFFFARIDSQIQGFKGDSAQENFIGGWQYKGNANCPAVLPYYFQRARNIKRFFVSVGECSKIGSDYVKAKFITNSFIYNQRPCAGVNQSLNGSLPDFMIFDKTFSFFAYIQRVFKRNFSVYY
jgi:hypothetical protein